MTTRSDVAMDFVSSPRVMEVNSPSIEMNMQDLVDTARKLEDSFVGMSYPKLLDASGKQDLGGFNVGITVAEQNMKLAFEGRTAPAETGIITSVGSTPVIGRQVFFDTAAQFQTNNVARGSLVINFTDQSIAEVYSVQSETEITTKTLVNGLTNTYNTLDVYHIYNVVQVTARGGNLTAVDDVDIAIPAVQATPFTQVIIELSSSATIVPVGSAVLPSDIVDIKDAIYDELIENGLDFRDFQKIMVAALAGKSDNMETTTGHFRDQADAKDRITVNMDGNGNRTSITFDLT